MRLSALDDSEYHAYYAPYLNILGDVELLPSLENGLEGLSVLIGGLSEKQLKFAYSHGKWTVAELLIHLFDAERVFQYRALRFGRGDTTDLPGFDQDSFVPQSRAAHRTKQDLLTEFKAIRAATIALFRSFDDESLLRIGSASGAKMSVRALGFVISGHQAHHLKILKERYL
ncbi:MAG: DinB family protein [Bacteroidota bacterium]